MPSEKFNSVTLVVPNASGLEMSVILTVILFTAALTEKLIATKNTKLTRNNTIFFLFIFKNLPLLNECYFIQRIKPIPPSCNDYDLNSFWLYISIHIFKCF